jgi:hypothetical protein
MARKITNNVFNVSNGTSSSITIEENGYCVINKLALIDEVTGNKWEVKVHNGEILIEPVELEDKRDYKIKKLLNE